MSAANGTDHGLTMQGFVPAQRVRLAEQVTAIGVPGQTAVPEPHVTLIRQGDVVEAIEIRCSCGELIRLRCQY